MGTESSGRHGAETVIPVVLSIVGAVCGVLITGAFASSPDLRLLGAALGAAIPSLIGVAGSFWGLRVGMGVAVTAVVLLFTYGGMTFVDAAAGQPGRTFPEPAEMVPERLKPNPEPTADGEPGIDVDPERLRCTVEGCDGPVTVESVGDEPLHVTTIEFDGAGAKRFRHDGKCEHRELDPGKTCTVEVSYEPSSSGGDGDARLVIHQNLDGPPTYVPLEVDGSSTYPDLAVSSAGTECVYQRDTIQVFFRIVLTSDADGFLTPVAVSATSNQGPATRFTTGVRSAGTRRAAVLPVDAGDMGRRHLITVRVDPSNEIVERNEDNNRFQISVRLPAADSPPSSLSC